MKITQKERSRIGRDEYFMQIAVVVAKRSTCLRAKVGAVMVRSSRILTTGYNGSPRGFPHCTPITCNSQIKHCQATVHAEMNAIVAAAFHGICLQSATLYCTHSPCLDCARVLINLGIKRIVVGTTYGSRHELSGIDLLEMGKIEVEFCSPFERTHHGTNRSR